MQAAAAAQSQSQPQPQPQSQSQSQPSDPAQPPAPAPAQASAQGRPGSAPADRSLADEVVEDYLENLALPDVLAARLRKRLAESQGAEKSAIADRLGAVYVALMAQAKTPEARQRLETRSVELIAAVPESDTFELRIDLSKVAYLRAEDLSERQRLKMGTPEERQEAERLLRAAAPVFREIATKVAARIDAMERREQAGRDDDDLRDQLADARRVRSLAMYYAGWSGYYLGLLTADQKFAARAVEDFGALLNAPAGKPATVERLPTNLLKYPHVARAALGCALCASLKGNDVEAMRWIDAVAAAADIAPDVQAQVFLRKLTVLAAAGRWADVDLVVRRHTTDAGERQRLTAAEARLLATSAMDAMQAANNTPRIKALTTELAQTALADLVAAGEIGHILDIVARYGTAPIGDTGFVVAYVRSLQAYTRAREQHESLGNAEEPTADPSVANRYREAASAVEIAISSADAPRFPVEREKAAMMLGLANYYASDFERSAAEFQKAASLASDDARKQEALWFAVVSLDRAVEAGKPSLTAERDRVALLFLSEFPRSEGAIRLLLRRAGAGLIPDDRAVAVLLDVAPESSLYPRARFEASQLLYRMIRKAPDREAAAARFLDVAEQSLAMEVAGLAAKRPDKPSDKPAEKDLSQAPLFRVAMQIVDVAAAMSPPAAGRAQNALATFDQAVTVYALNIEPVASDLLYRRLQVAILAGDDAAAQSAITQLRAKGGARATSAERLVYRMAARRWSASPDSVDSARRLVESGVIVVEQLEKDAGADAATLGAVANEVAGAAAFVWRRENNTEMRDLAIRLDRRSMARGFKPGPVLRRMAELSEAAGDPLQAIDAWNTLLAGLPQDSESWFEARYHSLRLLALRNPAQARDAMMQFVTLHPSFGPAPWGDKLREVAATLGVAPPSATATPPTPPAPTKGGGP